MEIRFWSGIIGPINCHHHPLSSAGGRGVRTRRVKHGLVSLGTFRFCSMSALCRLMEDRRQGISLQIHTLPRYVCYHVHTCTQHTQHMAYSSRNVAYVNSSQLIRSAATPRNPILPLPRERLVHQESKMLQRQPSLRGPRGLPRNLLVSPCLDLWIPYFYVAVCISALLSRTTGPLGHCLAIRFLLRRRWGEEAPFVSIVAGPFKTGQSLLTTI